MGKARNGDVELAYETFGSPRGAPLLLISGTGVQMLVFPEDLCGALADLGFQVARFDNRDTGLSTHLTEMPAPGWLTTVIRPSSAPYRLEDMAEDALAVLDALGWESAHLVGTSLGGMIAQTLALRHPTRVRTLTSVMSTPAARLGTMPKITTLKAIMKLSAMPVTGPDQAAREAVAMRRLIGSPRYPFDEKEVGDIGRRSYERHPGSPEADARQRAAVTASGDRRKALTTLRIPTLVLHGEDDPVIRLKGGRATAAAVPGARLVTYPGMGHDLPRQLWPSMLEQIRTLAFPQ
ncbi:alpha/beta fold hydrolase [Actinomadura violacea]|uniref:Alpha/beta fold hydrolase n=1 Tax=Actinomadura violacea TaxID=2819934 RepID=A0ABS3RNF7_9ACTN|nr:alpha/beta fold hydrolase [Actinomadura violacea]MBO2458281.1 alpha/beta fold hydrolase [Actinomadura violacea]